MAIFRVTRPDDTTAGQDRGRYAGFGGPAKARFRPNPRAIRAIQQKGGPKAALFEKPAQPGSYQFAALLAGLSVEVLSAVVGAVALTLTPCSRSSAIFRALSSLASGGT